MCRETTFSPLSQCTCSTCHPRILRSYLDKGSFLYSLKLCRVAQLPAALLSCFPTSPKEIVTTPTTTAGALLLVVVLLMLLLLQVLLLLLPLLLLSMTTTTTTTATTATTISSTTTTTGIIIWLEASRQNLQLPANPVACRLPRACAQARCTYMARALHKRVFTYETCTCADALPCTCMHFHGLAL